MILSELPSNLAPFIGGPIFYLVISTELGTNTMRSLLRFHLERQRGSRSEMVEDE
jgi:hypothetical protein